MTSCPLCKRGEGERLDTFFYPSPILLNSLPFVKQNCPLPQGARGVRIGYFFNPSPILLNSLPFVKQNYPLPQGARGERLNAFFAPQPFFKTHCRSLNKIALTRGEGGKVERFFRLSTILLNSLSFVKQNCPHKGRGGKG